MTSLDPKKHPPGGWMFQTTIGGRPWKAPDPSWPFLDICKQIRDVRENNNEKTTIKQIAQELLDYNATRLGLGTGTEGAEIVQKLSKKCAGCGAKKKR